MRGITTCLPASEVGVGQHGLGGAAGMGIFELREVEVFFYWPPSLFTHYLCTRPER